MYVIYQIIQGTGLRAYFYVDEDGFYHVMKHMAPSACQWIIPGTISPLED